jgi:hypothetical protein
MHTSLEEKRQREVRHCPQCQMEISNPFVFRCPRCFAIVPTQEPGCASCVHRMSCTVLPASVLKPSEITQ